MPTQCNKPDIDPAAYKLRKFIIDSKEDTIDLGVIERKFLANYLRINTSSSCEAGPHSTKLPQSNSFHND